MSINRIKFCTTLPKNLKDVLREINKNMMGIIFFVDDDFKLIGSLTDGDIRRALLKNEKINQKIDRHFKFLNKKPFCLPYNSSVEKILKYLDNHGKKNYKCIPLLNNEGRVVDVSTKHKIKNFPAASPEIGEEELVNIITAFRSGYISSVGKFIEQFEMLFEKYLGSGHAVAVSSGTSALQLGLSTLGISKNDEVIVPNFTFAASINSIINVGAIPVLVDIDKDNWTISINEIKKNITKKTKAIMPVHIYGQPAQMDEIYKLARQRKIKVIEDCAEAIGAVYKKKLIGSQGDCCCFSFFANKTLTTGEGGMVVFNNKVLAERARVLRDHGMSKEKKYWHESVGYNYRMTNIQAAIGVAQIQKINFLLKRKKNFFKNYDDKLKNKNNIVLMPKNKWSRNSYWIYTLRIKNFDESKRDELLNNLKDLGIDCRPGFYPLNKMQPFKKYAKYELKNSELISYNSISLPSSPNISKADQNHIVKVLLDEINNVQL